MIDDDGVLKRRTGGRREREARLAFERNFFFEWQRCVCHWPSASDLA